MNTTAPICTVVVPTLDPEPALVGRILRLSARAGPEFAWIVVDDGSGSAARDTFLRLEDGGCQVLRHGENLGLPAARNTGIRNAQSEFVLPLDDDDSFRSWFVHEAIELMTVPENENVAFVYCWVVLKGIEKGLLVTPPWDPVEMLRRNICCSCSVLRKASWEAVGGYDESFRNGLEDWDLWLTMIASGLRGGRVPAPGVTYNRKRGSMLDRMFATGSYWEARDRLARKHVELYRRMLPEWSLDEERSAWQPPHGWFWQVRRLVRTMPLRVRSSLQRGAW